MPTLFADLAARRGVVFPLRTERLTLTPFAAELRESHLAAGDRLTVRAGESIIDVGKLAVQDAWSQGGPREEARDAQGEIGWTIHPTHAGQGYATELAGALLKLAFTGLGVHRVDAAAFADNAPSLRASGSNLPPWDADRWAAHVDRLAAIAEGSGGPGRN